MKKDLLVVVASSTFACALQAQQMQPWLTRSADSSPSGWNSQETVLTQSSVKAKGVSFRTVVPVTGDARGMEAQPLILPKVTTKTRGVRDVMVLPSMADLVRGVDAHCRAASALDQAMVAILTPISSFAPYPTALQTAAWCRGTS